MVSTVSPASTCYSDTLSTLRFADRARAIVNRPVVNEEPGSRVVMELRAEVNRLRSLLALNKMEGSSVQTVGDVPAPNRRRPLSSRTREHSRRSVACQRLSASDPELAASSELSLRSSDSLFWDELIGIACERERRYWASFLRWEQRRGMYRPVSMPGSMHRLAEEHRSRRQVVRDVVRRLYPGRRGATAANSGRADRLPPTLDESEAEWCCCGGRKRRRESSIESRPQEKRSRLMEADADLERVQREETPPGSEVKPPQAERRGVAVGSQFGSAPDVDLAPRRRQRLDSARLVAEVSAPSSQYDLSTLSAAPPVSAFSRSVDEGIGTSFDVCAAAFSDDSLEPSHLGISQDSLDMIDADSVEELSGGKRLIDSMFDYANQGQVVMAPSPVDASELVRNTGRDTVIRITMRRASASSESEWGSVCSSLGHRAGRSMRADVRRRAEERLSCSGASDSEDDARLVSAAGSSLRADWLPVNTPARLSADDTTSFESALDEGWAASRAMPVPSPPPPAIYVDEYESPDAPVGWKRHSRLSNSDSLETEEMRPSEEPTADEETPLRHDLYTIVETGVEADAAIDFRAEHPSAHAPPSAARAIASKQREPASGAPAPAVGAPVRGPCARCDECQLCDDADYRLRSRLAAVAAGPVAGWIDADMWERYVSRLDCRSHLLLQEARRRPGIAVSLLVRSHSLPDLCEQPAGAQVSRLYRSALTVTVPGRAPPLSLDATLHSLPPELRERTSAVPCDSIPEDDDRSSRGSTDGSEDSPKGRSGFGDDEECASSALEDESLPSLHTLSGSSQGDLSISFGEDAPKIGDRPGEDCKAVAFVPRPDGSQTEPADDLRQASARDIDVEKLLDRAPSPPTICGTGGDLEPAEDEITASGINATDSIQEAACARDDNSPSAGDLEHASADSKPPVVFIFEVEAQGALLRSDEPEFIDADGDKPRPAREAKIVAPESSPSMTPAEAQFFFFKTTEEEVSLETIEEEIVEAFESSASLISSSSSSHSKNTSRDVESESLKSDVIGGGAAFSGRGDAGASQELTEDLEGVRDDVATDDMEAADPKVQMWQQYVELHRSDAASAPEPAPLGLGSADVMYLYIEAAGCDSTSALSEVGLSSAVPREQHREPATRLERTVSMDSVRPARRACGDIPRSCSVDAIAPLDMNNIIAMAVPPATSDELSDGSSSASDDPDLVLDGVQLREPHQRPSSFSLTMPPDPSAYFTDQSSTYRPFYKDAGLVPARPLSRADALERQVRAEVEKLRQERERGRIRWDREEPERQRRLRQVEDSLQQSLVQMRALVERRRACGRVFVHTLPAVSAARHAALTTQVPSYQLKGATAEADQLDDQLPHEWDRNGRLEDVTIGGRDYASGLRPAPANGSVTTILHQEIRVPCCGRFHGPTHQPSNRRMTPSEYRQHLAAIRRKILARSACTPTAAGLWQSRNTLAGAGSAVELGDRLFSQDSDYASAELDWARFGQL
ncbi:uncharacterized protein LOC119107604 [Pollicipes pollicipes]|uniref:uncharacterized protein LOC119107604 n=1 Tax=Pollicipes pollicipes TaxID=41117 RepID=UPI0018855C89|nr:uncharacterized protein LOC119107604 [Pollicipes pollicipes]